MFSFANNCLDTDGMSENLFNMLINIFKSVEKKEVISD